MAPTPLLSDATAVAVILSLAVATLLALAVRNRRQARPDPMDLLRRSLVDKGARFVGLSRPDRRAIGIDPSRWTLILARLTPDGVGTAEYPLDRVRDARWLVEGHDVLRAGPGVGLPRAMWIRAYNRAAMRHARAASGLFLDIADIDRPTESINLDGDEARLSRWLEILDQAFERRLPVPERPVEA